MIKTVVTTAGTNAIKFESCCSMYYWVRNIGETTIYVGTTADIAIDADNTAKLEAGECVLLNTYDNTVYVLGEGKVEIHESDTPICPFKLGGKGGVTVGDNLLINPDFKINQRGVSGTFSETGKYFVDRWRLVSGTVTVNADGTLTLNGTISQVFENAVGDNVTASVSAGTAAYDDSTKTFSIAANGEIISLAKLEYGGTATQFIPPDTATELLKCMRYYEVLIQQYTDRAVLGYIETNLKAYFDISFKVVKRYSPSLCAPQKLRVIVNKDNYYLNMEIQPIEIHCSSRHGIVVNTVEPVLTEIPTGYIAVTADTLLHEDGALAVDAEIY